MMMMMLVVVLCAAGGIRETTSACYAPEHSRETNKKRAHVAATSCYLAGGFFVHLSRSSSPKPCHACFARSGFASSVSCSPSPSSAPLLLPLPLFSLLHPLFLSPSFTSFAHACPCTFAMLQICTCMLLSAEHTTFDVVVVIVCMCIDIAVNTFTRTHTKTHMSKERGARRWNCCNVVAVPLMPFCRLALTDVSVLHTVFFSPREKGRERNPCMHTEYDVATVMSIKSW